MTGLPVHRVARGCRALLCALSWPAVASAQDDAFRRGLDARGDKNWNVVVTQMQDAIKSDPKESTRRVGGGLFRQGMEYLPHFFLGEALFSLQQCARAVEEWSISEQQGAVRVRREFVDAIANGYKTCAARGVLPPVEFTQQQELDSASGGRGHRAGGTSHEAWRHSGRLDARDARTVRARERRAHRGASKAGGRHLVTGRGAFRRGASRGRARDDCCCARSNRRINANIENLTAVRRQIREVDQLIAAAENGDRAIDGVKTELTPELASSRQSGRDLLARARERVRTGEKTQNLATVNEGLRSAQDALSVFKDVLEGANKLVAAALESQFKDALAIASEAVSFLDTAIATLAARVLGRQPPAGAEMTSQLEALQKRATTIRRRFDTAQKTQNVNGLKEAARLAVQARAELDALITSFGPVTLQDRGVHAALEDGARLFFAGEYQQVLTRARYERAQRGAAAAACAPVPGGSLVSPVRAFR